METYNEIYQRIKDSYTNNSGEDFDESGDIAIRMKVLAGEIYNMQTSLEWMRRQLFPSTASGVFLDRFAEQRGLTRKPAVKARGQLEFRVNETRATAISIPMGTVVSTDDETPVRVYTTEDSQIEPGTYSVMVPAEAEIAGYRGNINVRSAVVPVSVPSDIDLVSNLSAFTGGEDEESDTTLRERIRDSYVCMPNGMNAAYYIELVKSVDGISKAGVMAKPRGAGTLTVYVARTDGDATDAQLVEAQTLINNNRELNVDAVVARAVSQSYDMNVYVTAMEGFTNEEIVSLCTDAFEDYVNTIPLGGRLYLSQLGKYLLDTGCIKTYVFDQSMADMSIPASTFFVTGDVTVQVV